MLPPDKRSKNLLTFPVFPLIPYQNLLHKDVKMSRKCDISGKCAMSGNNVSHANNKTRRRFLPNLQIVSLLSETLGKIFRLKVTSSTLRSIEHNGGLDSYLESTSNTKLSPEALKIKKQIAKKTPAEAKAAKPAAKKTPAKTAAKKPVAKKAAPKAKK